MSFTSFHLHPQLEAGVKALGYNTPTPIQRQAALDGFRDGSFQVLVATGIAARGIDVSRISHVINYDMPESTDSYTHRIGRTGRAEKTGDAFTFVTREDEAMVHSIERVLGAKVERRLLPGFDYKKPAPARDTEFARPPHQPQRRRQQRRATPPRTRNGPAAAQKDHPVGSAGRSAYRSSIPYHSSGSTTSRNTRSGYNPRKTKPKNVIPE